MNKEVSVGDLLYSLEYSEQSNIWRIVEDEKLLSGYKLDLEVDLKFLQSEMNWKEIEEFILFLQGFKNIDLLVERCNIALKGLFRSVYPNYDLVDSIDFEFSGIEYLGCTPSFLGNEFEYNLFFFPFNRGDIHSDVGQFAWSIKMKDKLLYGVVCDI